ncbi:MAG TPA: hypothetical protein VFH51_00355 [Myxococcota bacterium]|nr:hypothetical protein [Myxococcota bacterium]
MSDKLDPIQPIHEPGAVRQVRPASPMPEAASTKATPSLAAEHATVQAPPPAPGAQPPPPDLHSPHPYDAIPTTLAGQLEHDVEVLHPHAGGEVHVAATAHPAGQIPDMPDVNDLPEHVRRAHNLQEQGRYVMAAAMAQAPAAPPEPAPVKAEEPDDDALDIDSPHRVVGVAGRRAAKTRG